MFLLVGEPAWDVTPRNKKTAKDIPISGVWGSRQSPGRGEGHPDGLGSPSLVRFWLLWAMELAKEMAGKKVPSTGAGESRGSEHLCWNSQ